MLTLKEQHEKCLYPEVRIRTKSALGSGTVIFCHEAPGEEGMWDTYVLTNEHVVDELISIDKRWNNVLKREVTEDALGHPDVEVFTFKYVSRVIGSTSYQADIVAYDKEEDMALLRVRAPNRFEYVAELYPEAEIRKLLAGEAVWCIGCGLGGPPIPTGGYLAAFNIDIENREFWCITAPMIFGNSGGATWLQDTGHFVGIPSRVSVKAIGWSIDVVTHIGFIIPVSRVYQFLRDQIWDFIIDPERTAEECERERQEKRERDLLGRLYGADEGKSGDNINPRGADEKHKYY